MPSNFGVGTVVTTKSQDITWLTVGGDKPHSKLTEIPSAATDANLAALREAVGDLSNAAVLQESRNTSLAKGSADVVAFDEAYADATTRLTLKFQNDALDIKEYNIPAPDAQFFGADGVTAIVPDAGGTDAQVLLQTAITAILTVINTGGGSYAYVAGYRSPLPAGFRVRAVPGTIREATEDDEPSDAPGLLA